MTDAIHDGLIVKSPCSLTNRPQRPREQRVYVATTDQVWQLYELFPERMLGWPWCSARSSACAWPKHAASGSADVDFLR